MLPRTMRRMALPTALLALMLGSSPVAADTPWSHGGQIGPHGLFDSAERAGVVCRYGNGSALSGVRAWPPVVYARDRTGGRDHQRVAWQIILQRQQDESLVWQTVKQSGLQSATAYDDAPADFSRRTLSHNGQATSAYRVLVKMLWYEPGDPNDVQGTAKHRVDYYTYALLGGDILSSCPGGVL